MLFHVWVDHDELQSELIEFSHDGRRTTGLLPRAVKIAAERGGRAITVAPAGSGPTEVKRITAKQRAALLP